MKCLSAIFSVISVLATTALAEYNNCWVGTGGRFDGDGNRLLGHDSQNLAPDGVKCRHNLPSPYWGSAMSYTNQPGALCCDACREPLFRHHLHYVLKKYN